MSRPPILQLGDPDCEDAHEAGGKGASLARMTRLGLPVPAAFVVRASVLADLLDSAGDRDRVLTLLARTADAGAGETARSIQPLVRALQLPAAFSDQIDGALEQLSIETGVAVRSSACVEDSDAASYAGQQDTYLNVKEKEEVPERIRDCWSSFFSERALFYRSRQGSLADLGMAVVVQRQIASDRSGVMFTVDPVRRRRDQMMIEAVWGLGEAVVSGHATPDHYVVSRDGEVKQVRISVQEVAIRADVSGGVMFTVDPVRRRRDQMMIEAVWGLGEAVVSGHATPDHYVVSRDGEVKQVRISVQEVAIRADVSGGVTQHQLTAQQGGARVLSGDDLGNLADLGRRLEAHFGSPQDVEFAFEGERLYVLQSRPVTA